MDFEAYKISEHNWQMYMLDDNHRIWLASFNKLSTLLDYYIFCHNLSTDCVMFTGASLDEKESNLLDYESNEWDINIME